jgi:hypothetical protein
MPPTTRARSGGINWLGVLAWGLGIVTYQWAIGSFVGLGLPGPSAAGASLPSLLVAGLAYLALARLAPREVEAPARR